MDRFVAKPIVVAELYAAIAECVGQPHAADETTQAATA
jgi:hypothetical protein